MRDGLMRVALISPTFGAYGGMEAFSLALARGLAPASGVELRLFFKQTKQFVARRELADAAASAGDRVQFLPRGSRALWRAIQWADVVHVQNASPDVVLLALVQRRRLLVSVINHRQPGSSLHQRAWAAGLRCADARFYISEFVRRSWEGPQLRAGSRVVFPICELAGEPAGPAARRGFAFAGRWIANKGIEALLEAYARAALDPVAWPLRLMGDGPLRLELERSLAARGLRGVSSLGFVSLATKVETIRTSRWMVVPPQTNEDFGLTALEARHLGVPCIVTRDGGVPEAAGAEALTCAPGDVAGLAACLRAAAAMPDAEYEARARATRETLLPQLAGPAFYAAAYRALAAR
jgi:glycosyltransferase involved in cell wall biosynthesis